MDKRRNGRRRGEGAFGLIVGIVVFGAAVIAAVKIVPVYIHGNEVLDAMNEAANFGGIKSEDKLAYDVYRKAMEAGVPLPLTDIKVAHRGPNIVISAKYQQVVDIFGYKYTYVFDRTVEKPTF